MAVVQTTLTRRDRNKLRNQNEILEAALEVFAEKGYRNASVQEIADRADFAVSTLYALFENKEDIYSKVSIEIGKKTGAIFADAMSAGGNEYEKLVNYARAKGEAFRVSPAGCRMLELELQDLTMNHADPLPQNGIGRIYARFMLQINKLFEDGIKNGLFADIDPVLMATAFDSATNGLMKLSMAAPEQYNYDKCVDEIIRIFFQPVLKNENTGTVKE